MPFSTNQVRDLKQKIRGALASGRVNDWERSFLQSVEAKLNKDAQRTSLSPKELKQLSILTNANARRSAERKHPRRRTAGRGNSHRQRRRSRRSRKFTFKSIAVGIGLTVVAGFFAVERFPEYMGPVVSWTSVSKISGRATHVRDGDTIEVSGVPIRFGSLDCAERNTASGRSATRRMRALVSGQRLDCYMNGRTSHDRKIGSCRLNDGSDLAAKMIREGACSRFW